MSVENSSNHCLLWAVQDWLELLSVSKPRMSVVIHMPIVHPPTSSGQHFLAPVLGEAAFTGLLPVAVKFARKLRGHTSANMWTASPPRDMGWKKKQGGQGDETRSHLEHVVDFVADQVEKNGNMIEAGYDLL